jgi:hypothetical protein
MATPTNLPAAATVGQVLTSDYVNNLRGAFRILQVVAATPATTQLTSTSTTFADVGLSATITPQSTTSKILIVYSVSNYNSGAITGMSLRLFRGATALITTADFGYNSSGDMAVYSTLVHYDSPASVSALTYKVQFNRNQGTNIVYVNTLATLSTGTMYLIEVSA